VPRPASAAENSFANHVVTTIAVDNALAGPVASLVGAIADCVGKLYPAGLERYGVSARDRVGPKAPTPLWELANRIARIFGTEVDVYEHRGPQPLAIVESFEVPALLISQSLRRLPLAQQAFLLAHAIGPAATRLYPALMLGTTELEIAIAGAVRSVSAGAGFTLPHLDDTAANNAREVFRKFVGRKWRRQLEVSAEELAQKAPGDIAAWQAAVRLTAIRAAALVSDDLASSLEAMRYVVELPDARHAALVQSSEIVRDVVRFWVSNRAAGVRQHAGMALV